MVVTYIETYTKPDETIRTSHEAGYLEKENGHWKLIGNFWIPEQAPYTETFTTDLFSEA